MTGFYVMGTLAFNELLLSAVPYITPESIGVIFPFINRKSNNVNTPTLELELKRGLVPRLLNELISFR